jgi:transglutaminase-like putative cysteine protease
MGFSDSSSPTSLAGASSPVDGGRPRPLLAIVVAAAAGLALIDAAVETFWAGSPIRWWVALAALCYAAAVLFAWRFPRLRGSWNARATTSVIALFAVLAATAWLPGALDDGVHLAGQPTSVVLAALTALGLIIAAALAWRARLSYWMRAAAVIAAAYGLSACIVGIVHATSYSSLLHGASLWTVLPFWLQGAFIGAFVVLPIALVVHVVQAGVRRLRRTRDGRWDLARIAALAASVALALATWPPASRQTAPAAAEAGFRMPGATASQLARVPLRRPAPPPAESASQIAAQTEQLAEGVPLADYDVEAKADTLGPGVAPSFDFVRDFVRFESYSGALRGTAISYTSRAGNAVDRSVLLASLLRRKGIHTRLAVGHLSRADAERLFESMFTPRRDQPQAHPVASPALVTAAQSFRNAVTARASRDYGVIRTALGSKLPAGGGPTKDEVLGEIEQHAWVQASVDGKWIDLDTAFPDGAVGQAHCPVTATYDDIPDQLLQHVAIRVVEERLTAGQLVRSTLLEHEFRTALLLDSEVFLIHRAGAGGGAEGSFGAAISGTGSWTPMLWVAGETIQGRPLELGAEGASGGVSSRFTSAGGFFDSLSASSQASTFVAEWLEFELRFPSGRHEVSRRVVLDRAGAAWRATRPLNPATLAPLARDSEGPLAPRVLYNIWFSGGRHNLAAYSQGLAAMAALNARSPIGTPASQQVATTPKPPLPFAYQIWPLAMATFAWAVWTDHVAIPGLNDRPDIRFYSDSPRILIFSIGPDSGASAGIPAIQVDLRRDHVRGVARNPSASSQVIERKIWFGALEGSFEHEGLTAQLSVGFDAPEVTSTSSLLDATGAIRLDDPSQAGSFKDGDAAAAARQALTVGALLVVPHRATTSAPAGWWQIAPDTADTRPVLGSDLNGVELKAPPGGLLPNGKYVPQSTGAKTSWTKEALDEAIAKQKALGGARGPSPKTEGGAGGEFGEYLDALIVAWTAASAFEQIAFSIQIVVELAMLAWIAFG